MSVEFSNDQFSNKLSKIIELSEQSRKKITNSKKVSDLKSTALLVKNLLTQVESDSRITPSMNKKNLQKKSECIESLQRTIKKAESTINHLEMQELKTDFENKTKKIEQVLSQSSNPNILKNLDTAEINLQILIKSLQEKLLIADQKYETENVTVLKEMFKKSMALLCDVINLKSTFLQQQETTFFPGPSNSLEPLSKLIPSLTKLTPVHFKTQKSPLYSIPVLSQTEVHELEVHCGRHAFKNGIVLLGLGSQFSNSDLKDKEVYLPIKKLIAPEQQEDDISASSVLEEVWGTLSSSNTPNPHPIIEKARIVVHSLPDALSALVYEKAESTAEQGKSSFSGAFCLRSLSNLLEIKKNIEDKTPFRHAFLMGSEGHWVTLVLEHDAKGLFSWYGADSMNNMTFRFKAHIKFIESVLENISRADFVRAAYTNAIGEDLKRRSNYLTSEGRCEDPENNKVLIAQAKELLTNISLAITFMERVGWLNNPEAHKDMLEPTISLIKFFRNNGYADDPIMQHIQSLFLAKAIAI